jgi:hypothetical protein
MATLSELVHDALAMVALDFNHTILHGPAGAAYGAELLAKQSQCDRIKR